MAGGIALVLLSGLMFVAAAGLATGQPEGPFGTTPRVPGDHGAYRVAHVPNGTGAGVERDRIFAVQDPLRLNAADGQVYDATAVREAWLVTDRDGDLRESWRISYDDGLEPASAEVLVAHKAWSGLHCTSGLLGCTTVSVYENALYEIETDHSRTVYGQDGGLCGLRNEAQGGKVGLSKPVLFLGDCATPRLRAIRETSLPGHERVVVFAGEADGRVSQVWLADDVAYPLRVWDGLANGTGTAYTLSEVGNGRPSQAGTSSTGPLSMPGSRARTALGPSTDGFTMEWPLATAIEAGRSLQGSQLATFLGENPDAPLAAAAFSEVTNGHWRQRTWRVEYATEPPQGFAIQYGQPEDGEPAATAPFYSRDPSAAVDGDLSVSGHEPRPDLAPAALLPPSLPAVPDVVRLYDQVRPAGSEWDANAWAFAVTCPPPCAAQEDVDAWVAAGLTRVFSDQVGATQRFGVPELQPVITTHVRMVAARPESLAFIERVDQVRSPYDHTPPQDAETKPEWVLATSAKGEVWTAPGPLLAAGTGLALLVAAVLVLVDALRHGASGLFSRIATSALHEHPVRADLLAAVGASPGVHFSELARRIQVAPGVAQHHLGKLIDAGLVLAVRSGGHTRYFPPGATPQQTVQAQALATAGAAEVLQAVRARPGISVSDLAAATGRTAGTVSHHLDRLVKAGLVERRRQGRSVGVYPGPLDGAGLGF